MSRPLLRPGAGLPPHLLAVLATVAGVSVANLYYNQPLLEMLRVQFAATTLAANRIALYAQVGYALGLLFVIPLADLASCRRIVVANLALLAAALAGTALAQRIEAVQALSFLIGVCSVMPHLFIPLAAQYSTPELKTRNVGIVLSGLLVGILASRVVSGAVGELWGWRTMYWIAAGLMVAASAVVVALLPDAQPNFSGSYGALMRSLLTLVRRYPVLPRYSVRAACAFASFMCFWASLAFRMAGEPFRAGSDVVGLLGLCGVAGALTASVVGRWIERVGVQRFNRAGCAMHLAAWVMFGVWGDSYAGLVAGIVVIDVGMQCIQLSNQALLFDLEPSASNRINTIFMSIFFTGGALGTLLSGVAWNAAGWGGVVATGAALTLAALALAAKRE